MTRIVRHTVSTERSAAHNTTIRRYCACTRTAARIAINRDSATVECESVVHDNGDDNDYDPVQCFDGKIGKTNNTEIQEETPETPPQLRPGVHIQNGQTDTGQRSCR